MPRLQPFIMEKPRLPHPQRMGQSLCKGFQAKVDANIEKAGCPQNCTYVFLLKTNKKIRALVRITKRQ